MSKCSILLDHVWVFFHVQPVVIDLKDCTKVSTFMKLCDILRYYAANIIIPVTTRYIYIYVRDEGLCANKLFDI